jgi:3-dehydroquinate dehydratase-2
MNLLVIHGPNLNLLGTREPEIYGTTTLAELNQLIDDHAASSQVQVECFQSNHEGEIIDQIQRSSTSHDAIIINPGAYTHTSIAIYDALRAIETPAYEVHLSNIHARGDMRNKSVTAGACVGIISGFGVTSYLLAIDAAIATAP